MNARRRLIDTSAAIQDAESGAIVADAEAVFMRVSAEQASAWSESYGSTNRTDG